MVDPANVPVHLALYTAVMLVALGLPDFRNSDIAEQLYLSPMTVRNHITSIFDKLQLADRAEAIVRAREAGLANRPVCRLIAYPGNAP